MTELAKSTPAAALSLWSSSSALKPSRPSMEGLEGFKADDELHKERAAAGVDLANSVTTPMGDDLLEQYKG